MYAKVHEAWTHFFDQFWPQGREEGEIRASELNIMRCGLQQIVLPLELLGHTLSGPKQKIQNWQIIMLCDENG